MIGATTKFGIKRANPAPPLLSDIDTAAWEARMAWCRQANDPRSGGKQLPPNDPNWLIMLMRGGRGMGKRLSLDTPVPTPSGWTTMGDVKAGDMVYDEQGAQCRVVQAHPVDLSPDSMRVTFSDGTSIDACADHLWVTWTHRDRKQYQRYEAKTDFPLDWVNHRVALMRADGDKVGECGPEIRTTAQIAATMVHGGRRDLEHCIPVTRPLQCEARDLPISPYALGYWLGNGAAKDGSVTTGSYRGNFDDPEIEASLLAEGWPVVTRRIPDKGQATIKVVGLTSALKRSDLFDNKHIPPAYLRASVVDRLALLQGLCDSDGHVTTQSGFIEFCSIDQRLALAVLELVRSLGERPGFNVGRATLYGVDHGPKYRVQWRTSNGLTPFRLRRKVAALRPLGAQALRMRHRMIVSVDRIPSVPMRCITVDSPNGMYLVGDGMIPTHNTRTLTEFLWWEAYRIPGFIGHAVAPTLSDVRGTLFEGPAGFNSVVPAECLLGGTLERAYNKSTHELRLWNGSLIRGFGAVEEAGRLRGPQCHALVGDELREWDRPPGNLELALNNALFGLRLRYPDGTPSRAVLATTPKPIPFLKRFERRKGLHLVTGSSYGNIHNLADAYREQLLSLEGTLLGRQEIDGVYIDEESDLSIFKRRSMSLWPKDKKLPEFSFVIEAYDTAYEEAQFDKVKQTRDPTACIVLGVFNLAQVFTPEKLKLMGMKMVPGRPRNAVVLCDAWSDYVEFPDLLEKARLQHRTKWGVPGRRSDIVLIEEKASGKSLRQMLARYDVPAWPYNPGQQSKTTRAHAVSPIVAQRLLFIPESSRPDRKGMPRDWCEPFLEQVTAFAGPGSVEHDDYVDSLTSALLYLRDREILGALPDERYVDYEQKIAEDRDEALEIERSNKRKMSVNPYG